MSYSLHIRNGCLHKVWIRDVGWSSISTPDPCLSPPHSLYPPYKLRIARPKGHHVTRCKRLIKE